MRHNDITPKRASAAIMRALDRKKAQDDKWEAAKRRHEIKSKHSEVERSEFLAHCQTATLTEYTAWMIGYLNRGGEPSHIYDHGFTQPEPRVMVLAEKPGAVPTLYGADSLQVIVPAGVSFAPEDVPQTFHGRCGHSTFYFMEGFAIVGIWTPVYSDMLPMLADQV